MKDDNFDGNHEMTSKLIIGRQTISFALFNTYIMHTTVELGMSSTDTTDMKLLKISSCFMKTHSFS